MNPFNNPDAYDRIILAGKGSPGVVTLSGHGRKEGWDVKGASGQDGASTTRKGKELAKFKASFYLVFDPTLNIDEYTAWELFLVVLKSSTSGDVPKGLDIYHPDLAELDITSVVVTDIGGKRYDGKGGATVDVEFLEYRAPKPKKATGPTGSKGGSLTEKALIAGGEAVGPTDPYAQVNDEIAQLQKQVNNLEADAGEDGQGGEPTTIPSGGHSLDP